MSSLLLILSLLCYGAFLSNAMKVTRSLAVNNVTRSLADNNVSRLIVELQHAINLNDANAVSIICRIIPDINAPEISFKVSKGSPSHPLGYAFSHGSIEAAEALFAAGANPLLQSGEKKDRNVLYYACRCFGNSEKVYVLIREMLAKGAKDLVNLKVEDDSGFWSYPLHRAVTFSKAGPLIKMLIENGADFEALNGNGESPLFAALKFEKIEPAQALIDAGANPFAFKQLPIVSPEYPPKNLEELVELLHKARVNWLFKHYKDLYLLYKTTGLIDSQVEGLRDFFLVEIWRTLYELQLHPAPLNNP